MVQQIQAVYEDGVFRPLTPLLLPERARVTLSVEPANQGTSMAISEEEFDRILAELSAAGPILPADFSRADIYADHD